MVAAIARLSGGTVRFRTESRHAVDVRQPSRRGPAPARGTPTRRVGGSSAVTSESRTDAPVDVGRRSRTFLPTPAPSSGRATGRCRGSVAPASRCRVRTSRVPSAGCLARRPPRSPQGEIVVNDRTARTPFGGHRNPTAAVTNLRDVLREQRRPAGRPHPSLKGEDPRPRVAGDGLRPSTRGRLATRVRVTTRGGVANRPSIRSARRDAGPVTARRRWRPRSGPTGQRPRGGDRTDSVRGRPDRGASRPRRRPSPDRRGRGRAGTRSHRSP